VWPHLDHVASRVLFGEGWLSLLGTEFVALVHRWPVYFVTKTRWALLSSTGSLVLGIRRSTVVRIRSRSLQFGVRLKSIKVSTSILTQSGLRNFYWRRIDSLTRSRVALVDLSWRLIVLFSLWLWIDRLIHPVSTPWVIGRRIYNYCIRRALLSHLWCITHTTTVLTHIIRSSWVTSSKELVIGVHAHLRLYLLNRR
jgi:hypothetical protein